MIHPLTGPPWCPGGMEEAGPPVPREGARLLAPVEPPNIICLGLNYRRHAEETGLKLPESPLFFLKATTALTGPFDPIILPAHYPNRVDYEVELGVVMGREAKSIGPEEAREAVLGFTVANDVSNRKAQGADGQWARAKSYDSFCPVGPELVTGLDPANLALTCRVDGRVMQSSSTRDMIFGVWDLVSYLSECMTLLPGTLILTGTPEGVGFTRKPPFYLEPGMLVECEVEGIGTIRNRVEGRGAGS